MVMDRPSNWQNVTVTLQPCSQFLGLVPWGHDHAANTWEEGVGLTKNRSLLIAIFFSTQPGGNVLFGFDDVFDLMEGLEAVDAQINLADFALDNVLSILMFETGCPPMESTAWLKL